MPELEVSTTAPNDYPDKAKYASSTDTAYITYLDMHYGIRPIALIFNDKKGSWILPISEDEHVAKLKIFRDSEYFKHHIKHRHYLRIIQSIKEKHPAPSSNK